MSQPICTRSDFWLLTSRTSSSCWRNRRAWKPHSGRWKGHLTSAVGAIVASPTPRAPPSETDPRRDRGRQTQLSFAICEYDFGGSWRRFESGCCRSADFVFRNGPFYLIVYVHTLIRDEYRFVVLLRKDSCRDVANRCLLVLYLVCWFWLKIMLLYPLMFLIAYCIELLNICDR